MTKAEKCDCCRQRKVKCDEKRPTCGPCAKTGRECKYTYGKVSGFVNYQHESSTTSGGPSPSSSSSRKHRSHDDSKSSSSASKSGKKGKGTTDEGVVLSLRSSKSAQPGNNSGLMQTFNLVPASSSSSRKPSASGGGKSSSGKSSSSKKPSRRSDSGKTPGPSETTGAEMWDGLTDWEPDSFFEEESSSLFVDWLSFLGGSGSLFSDQESALYCLGDWVDTVAQYVGQNGVVDAAVTAVLCGAAVFRERTEENVVMARESNMNALRMLRLSLSEDRQNGDSRGALVATKLLDLAELLINPETYHRQHHVRGLIDILRRLYSQDQAYDETIQSIYYSQFFAENMRAMYRGEPSAFERTSWYDMDAPSLEATDDRWPGYTFALKTTMQTFIRLARLVYMTRQAGRHHRDSHGLRAGAAHLALELFEGGNLDGWVGGLLDNGAVRVAPTADQDAQVLTPHSYRFASPRLYQLLVTYWTSRLVLCGCLTTLATAGAGAAAERLDPVDVQEADLGAANSVAMCVDYCLQLDPTLPCAQAVQLAPLRAAFGAWHRLAGRDGLRGAAGAGDVMAWCLTLVNNMEGALSLRFSSQEELVRRASCLAAGPVYET